MRHGRTCRPRSRLGTGAVARAIGLPDTRQLPPEASPRHHQGHVPRAARPLRHADFQGAHSVTGFRIFDPGIVLSWLFGGNRGSVGGP